MPPSCRECFVIQYEQEQKEYGNVCALRKFLPKCVSVRNGDTDNKVRNADLSIIQSHDFTAVQTNALKCSRQIRSVE